MIKKLFARMLGKQKFNSIAYWENRYANGDNSGDGSYGRLAHFKADFINQFLKENGIDTALEMGCGDGHQLSIIHYPSYTGMDVSSTVIEACKKKFQGDPTKHFLVYDPANFIPSDEQKVDLSLSLDVLYHIVEEKNYFKYLKDLFHASKQFVMIYSTNFYLEETSHVLHRKFTDDVTTLFPDWKLIVHKPNLYSGNGEQESMADFYVYERK